jgi:hypothetical protein
MTSSFVTLLICLNLFQSIASGSKLTFSLDRKSICHLLAGDLQSSELVWRYQGEDGSWL